MASQHNVSNPKHHSKDYLTTLPSELLTVILQHLSCLSLLRARLAHPRLAACIDIRPDYQKYQEVYRRMRQQLRKDRPRLAQAPKEGWPITRAAKLYYLVCIGNTTLDWYTFVFLERLPEASAYVRVIDLGPACGGVWGGGGSKPQSRRREGNGLERASRRRLEA